MLIAVDFDNTLFYTTYPKIDRPNWDIVNKCKDLIDKGNTLILWTCRQGNDLKEAISACNSVGLNFEYVNENPPHKIELYQNDCRKIGADYYLDDKNLTFSDFLKL